MPRMDKLSTYRTSWHEDGERGSVKYVNTVIVTWGRDFVTLNSGGWQTVTTKRKMNQAARQFALGFGVCQEAGEWYVVRRVASGLPGPVEWRYMPFEDGMTFPKGPLTGLHAREWGYATIKEAKKAA